MDNTENKMQNTEIQNTENVAQTVPEAVVETQPIAETEQTVAEEPKVEESKKEEPSAPVQAAIQPSKFALTAKQILTVIKNFFSKNAVDSIAAQYEEKLPIWGILLPAYVLLSAISATVSFNAKGNVSNQLGNVLSNIVSFGSGEVFFITLFTNAIFMFTMIIGFRAFIKAQGGDGHFLSGANLISAAQLPIMMFLAFNIITGGAISSIIDAAAVLGEYAMIMLIFAGVRKILDGRKPIWSFFLMIICVTVVAAIVAMIVISPILFSRVAYSLIDTLR
ncbi:MAG: hypothetical protein J1E41_05080 [Ruminococcus sp.]|nr:hypothetical protein [Ruminococcus sp.]